ncbi:MAG: nascent polypeptide-associated complex protein [archaeon]|nr:nascent polypeptide-associated complex protein [archaeon]
MAGGMRGVNPRQMQRTMRSMGITQTNVENVIEVIIRTRDKDIVISNAEVACINMQGQKNYQVVGTETILPAGSAGSASAGPSFTSEDIELVMSQANCDRDKAVKALEECDGQPAEAIIKLMSE